MQSPLLLALLAALVAGLVLSFALGLWRSSSHETVAGLTALCALKWRDFAHLIEDVLQERGFARANEDRSPGDGGFDLLMTRGSSRYLVQFKNGAAHKVSEQGVAELASQVELKGAEGAVLATTGTVEPAALHLAANRRVEILAGSELWRQVRPFVPHDLRTEIHTRSYGEFFKRLSLSVLGAAIVGLGTAALIPTPEAPTATAVTGVDPASTAVTTPVAAPARAPVEAEARPAIDASLSEEQLAARRAGTAMEVRNDPVVSNAVWSTRSTLVVSLRQSGAEIPETLFDQICRIVVQHEEQRYTRLQIESPAAEAGGTATVRWRQCR